MVASIAKISRPAWPSLAGAGVRATLSRKAAMLSALSLGAMGRFF
jgi:hypothetical protein